MNKFAEIVKTNKARIIKGALVATGATAGLIVGLGALDAALNANDDATENFDATDTDSSDPTPETD